MIPKDVRSSIENLLAYNMPTEQRDFEEWVRECGDDVTGHIYQDLRLIEEWLEGEA